MTAGDPGRSPIADLVVAAMQGLSDAPRDGDTIRVRLADGAEVRRRVTGHVHVQAGALAIEVAGAHYASSHAAVQVGVRGLRGFRRAHRDAAGWYVDASEAPVS